MFRSLSIVLLVAGWVCVAHADPSSRDVYASVNPHRLCELDDDFLEKYEAIWKELAPLLAEQMEASDTPEKIDPKALKRCYVGGQQLKRISKRFNEMGDSACIDADNKSQHLTKESRNLALKYITTRRGLQESARCEGQLQKSEKRHKSDVDRAMKLFEEGKFEEGEKIIHAALDDLNDSLVMLPTNKWSRYTGVFVRPNAELNQYSKTRASRNAIRLEHSKKRRRSMLKSLPVESARAVATSP